MLLFDDKEFIIESKFLIPLCITGEKKEIENIGLDFPISIENRLNLSTIAHVIRIIFCILSVWLFFCCCCLFIFPFFGVVRFPFHPQCFFPDAPSSFFFAFYTLDFVTYIFETPFFLCTNRPSSRTKRYVRHVWDILGSLLLCQPVENSESADRKSSLQSGLIWAPFTRIRTKKSGFKNVQIRVDMAFRSCLQGGRVTLVLGGLP